MLSTETPKFDSNVLTLIRAKMPELIDDYLYNHLFSKKERTELHDYIDIAVVNILDTPQTVEDHFNQFLQMLRIYMVCRIEAKKNGYSEVFSMTDKFSWINIYIQPLPTLLTICGTVGIIPHSRDIRDVLYAMKNHKFTMLQIAMTSMFEYAVKSRFS